MLGCEYRTFPLTADRAPPFGTPWPPETFTPPSVFLFSNTACCIEPFWGVA